MLGAAGLGKTYELSVLRAQEQQNGRKVIQAALGMLANDATGLRGELERLSDEAGQDGMLILDALDEIMVPIRQAALVLKAWIDRSLRGRVPLRIACRSPVWPNILTKALEMAYGVDEVLSVELLPLEDGDIRVAVQTEGINPDRFMTMIEQARAASLAARPLTLRLLIEEYRERGAFQIGSRDDLFRRNRQFIPTC